MRRTGPPIDSYFLYYYRELMDAYEDTIDAQNAHIHERVATEKQ